MSYSHLLSGLIVLFLLIYMLVALFKPELF